MKFNSKKHLIQTLAAGTLMVLFLGASGVTFAEGTSADPCAAANVIPNSKSTLQASMQARQAELAGTETDLTVRVTAMKPTDPKQPGANSALNAATSAINAFKDLSPGDEIVQPVAGCNYFVPSSATLDTPFQKKDWQGKELAAVNAINALNQSLIIPMRPGVDASGQGGVPKGDIQQDIIPQLIRILFRFSYFGILLCFIVSGIMLITAFDNEEQSSRAKSILTWAVVGFMVITLAFTVVKAVTQINFFAF